MEQWLKTNFSTMPDGTVIVYRTSTSMITYDPADPEGFFKSITAPPPTYAQLSALPCASQGWQRIFDQWKANGKVQ